LKVAFESLNGIQHQPHAERTSGSITTGKSPQAAPHIAHILRVFVSVVTSQTTGSMHRHFMRCPLDAAMYKLTAILLCTLDFRISTESACSIF